MGAPWPDCAGIEGRGYLKILHPPFNFLPSREERELTSHQPAGVYPAYAGSIFSKICYMLLTLTATNFIS